MLGAALLLLFAAAAQDDALRALDEKLKSPDDRKKVDALYDLAKKVGTVDALRRIVPFFLQPGNAYVGDRAVAAFADAADPKALAAVAKEGLASSEARIRIGTLEALLRTRTAFPPELPLVALNDREPEARRLALESILARHPVRVPPELPKLTEPAAGDASLRATAILAWAELDSAGSASAVAAAARDSNETLRIAALLSRGSEAVAALDDRSPRVRLAALSLLEEEERSAAAVRKLLDRMPRESGRVKSEVVAVLRSLTGRDFGDDVAAWERWWKQEGETFTPPARGRKEPADATGTRADLPRYHELVVASDRVAFLIDASGSMRERAGPDGTRLERAAAALRDVIRRLPKGTRVSLIVFNEAPLRFRGAAKALEADEKLADEAAKFVLGIGASKKTNIGDALELVLDDPDVDTVYLLSDGNPSAGKRNLGTRIVAWVKRVVRWSRTEVNTIALGADEKGADFLRKVAEATGGKFVRR